MKRPLRVLVVEDEVLLMMQLESYLEDAGHIVVGTAMSSREAVSVAAQLDADLALIDIHLADGPTGVEVGRFITERTPMTAVFMTANPKRIPEDFSGAAGVIAKPYTEQGLMRALDYLVDAVLDPPPTLEVPRSIALAPAYAQKWARSDHSGGAPASARRQGLG